LQPMLLGKKAGRKVLCKTNRGQEHPRETVL
jgi:hypothetical protein